MEPVIRKRDEDAALVEVEEREIAAEVDDGDFVVVGVAEDSGVEIAVAASESFAGAEIVVAATEDFAVVEIAVAEIGDFAVEIGDSAVEIAVAERESSVAVPEESVAVELEESVAVELEAAFFVRSAVDFGAVELQVEKIASAFAVDSSVRVHSYSFAKQENGPSLSVRS